MLNIKCQTSKVQIRIIINYNLFIIRILKQIIEHSIFVFEVPYKDNSKLITTESHILLAIMLRSNH